jgi:catechol-2,3-dioxygenase
MQINRVELYTNDLKGTINFYSDLLGLEKAAQDDTTVSFNVGRSVLQFRVSDKPCQYHFAFNIPCNQLQDALAWLSEKGKVIEVAPGNKIADFSSWNAEAVYFYDNNGNILECIARHDLQNESDQPFGPAALESISEIGLVVDDPESYAASLADQFGLPYFSKWKLAPDFVVLGDDHGLLIIVKKGRGWYPTQEPAVDCPVTVECEDRDKVQVKLQHD